jgi:hypothetical protein
MLTRRGFTGFASCAVTGFIASEASAQGAPPAVPGVKRTILSQMDGPMPGYVTINMEVEIDPGVTVARHTHPGIESSYVLEGGRRPYWRSSPWLTRQSPTGGPRAARMQPRDSRRRTRRSGQAHAPDILVIPTSL